MGVGRSFIEMHHKRFQRCLQLRCDLFSQFPERAILHLFGQAIEHILRPMSEGHDACGDHCRIGFHLVGAAWRFLKASFSRWMSGKVEVP
jgi:hypothetical protein